MHVSKQTRRLTVCYSTFVVISEKLTMLLHVAWNSTSVHAQAVRLILIFLMYCPLSMHRRSDLYLFFNVFLALWWWWWWWWLFPRLQGFLEIVRPLIPRLRSFLYYREISSRTLIPFFMLDDRGRMFPDKLHVNSFPDRFPHYAWSAA